MASDVIKSFFVSLGYKPDASLQQFENTVGGITKQLTKWSAILTGGSLVGAFANIAHSAKQLDELGHYSFLVNTTVTDIEKLGYAASISGSNIEEAKSSLAGLASAAGQTALGVGRAKVVFQKLGLSVVDANGKVKDSLQLMTELSEKLKPLGKSEQLSVLDKLQVSRGLLETLTTDVSGLTAEFDEMQKKIGVNYDESAKKAMRFSDAMYRLKFTVSAISTKVNTEFFGAFADSFDSFRKDLIEAAPAIVTTAVAAIKTLSKVISIAAHTTAGFFIGLVGIDKALGHLPSILAAITVAVYALNFAMNLNPFVLITTAIITLISAIGLLIDDFKTFEKGGKSLINWSPGVVKAINAISDAYKKLSDLINSFKFSFDKVNDIGLGLSGAASGGKQSGFHPSFARTLYDFTGIKLNSGIATNGTAASGLAGANNNVSVNNPVTINVMGTGDATSTANAVAATQNRVSQNMVRNLQGNVR